MEKITSRRNFKCLNVKNLGKSKEYRYEHGEFLCDGLKLLEEAIKSGAQITGIFTTSQVRIKLPKETDVYLVDESIMDMLSPLKNPQDILFTCKIPESKNINFSTGTHILLDNVQDPGNVGAIIRSADAFGIDSILLTEACADPYNPKTIRASMGAVFRQKVSYITIEELKNINLNIIGTGNSSEYTDIKSADFKNSVIVLGNEGQGISPALHSLCSEMITIPLTGESESLNVAVAASIIMWEAGRGK